MALFTDLIHCFFFEGIKAENESHKWESAVCKISWGEQQQILECE